MAFGVGSRRWLVVLLAAVCGFWQTGDAFSQSKLSPGYAAGDAGLTPSQRAGREIWFFATAFNDRFYTYSYPQRLGAAIDWYLVLAAKNKGDLFQAWGGIPDPDCCVPGATNCPAKSLDETYGFQFCPGDAELLKFVGKEGYTDPACNIDDAPFDTGSVHRGLIIGGITVLGIAAWLLYLVSNRWDYIEAIVKFSGALQAAIAAGGFGLIGIALIYAALPRGTRPRAIDS